ncbi:IpaD/SipD/SspD family type III secretion system needle tip protein [Chromobacterium phragmitis]|uniref:Translocator protein BipD n=1 Tax=Chromobacterium phragmitis TaxID=2202141 RepID=A0A344UDM7_9NEIS|nr:type III secretion system needle tip protein SctA [Chromobacterium phragmitis]AXE31986.1 IpaD/SipD/SspD family type III secretion system needle tip protein [Chromobacterium phragmitis]AXE33375.1 IpaD/SipD/SspD family type III secretion system needle tip protein [Chromobacterium phragmitis]
MIDTLNRFSPGFTALSQDIAALKSGAPTLDKADEASRQAASLRDGLDSLLQAGDATPELKPARDAAVKLADALTAMRDGIAKGMLPTADDFARLELDLHLLQGHLGTEQGQKLLTIPDSELWQKIADGINGINNNYLKVYEELVGKYTAFYQAFSDRVLAELGSWISSNDKGDKITLNVSSLKDALEKLKTEFGLGANGAYNEKAVLFPRSGTTTQREAEQWAKELGLPTSPADKSCVQESPKGSGQFVVVLDISPIDNMIKALNDLPNGGKDLDNAKFQSWKAGFDSQEEKMKNTLQTLTQKYSNANSLFDNLVKVLSGTISSCLETAKAFLHI